MLGESGDELFVLGVIAVLSENAEVGILSVKSLTDLVESLNKT